MVKKKDGPHRFCVDHRGVNEVMKKDTFPLPQIDDLNSTKKNYAITELETLAVVWAVTFTFMGNGWLYLVVEGGILFYTDSKHHNRKRVAVSGHLRNQLLREMHGGKLDGHFLSQHTYNALAMHWWWMEIYTDTCRFCKRCPQCVIITGSGQVKKPPLYPIPVQRPFQIFGVDVMD